MMKSSNNLPGEAQPLTIEPEPPPRPELAPLDPRERYHMEQLWSRMTAIYGGLWRSSYNASDITRRIAQREWLDAIRREQLTWKQVTQALNACAAGEKERPDMPPSLPLFITLAKPRTIAAHQPFQHLPAPSASPEERRTQGRNNMAKLKGILSK
jgi:hypothetical protein